MTRGENSLRRCLSCDQVKHHRSRGLCTACYKRHESASSLEQFPPLREQVSPKARYEAWVASGLMPNEFARQLGILNTSLSRSLRIERARRDRLGLSWLTGWRKERGNE